MSCSRLFDSLRCLHEKVDSFQYNRSYWVNDVVANLSVV